MAATAVGLAVGGATPEASAPCTGKGEECVGGGGEGGGVETIQKGGMHDEGEVNDRRSEVRRD